MKTLLSDVLVMNCSGLCGVSVIRDTPHYFLIKSNNNVTKLIFPRFNGHFYDVDKGVRDERREEEV
jgi:hypothetical protein